ncbi:MAG: HAMP domain-containing protein, partial [Burkholderiales bacterium]
MALSMKQKFWLPAVVTGASFVAIGLVVALSEGVQAEVKQGVFTVLGVGAVAMVACTRWLVHLLQVTIGQAIGAASRLAKGDLTEDIRHDRTDEAGRLLDALNEAQGAMRRSVSQVRQTAESIQVASGEVAAGNQDLSGRTEQTASSLQQTASSMEQLTGTVRQTADSARTANQLASSAAKAAQRGGEVVSQVVINMEEISTSSRKIADIIGV